MKVLSKAPTLSDKEYPVYEAIKQHWVTHKDEVKEIAFAKTGPAARPEDGGIPLTTINAWVDMVAEKRPRAVALACERPCPPAEGSIAPPSQDLSSWKRWSYRRYREVIRQTAKACMQIGASRYDGVSIFGFNSPEWFFGILGAMYGGFIPSGIYPSDTADQVKYKATHTNCVVAILENEQNYAKFASVADDIPSLKAVVAWGYDDIKDITRSDGTVIKGYTWKDFIALGKDIEDKKLDEVSKSIKPEDTAVFVYTSGTTGNPKAVMLSHDNIVYEATVVRQYGAPEWADEAGRHERLVSYLPLSHVAGMMVDIIVPLMTSAVCSGYTTVYFVRPYDFRMGTIVERFKAVRPTIFLGVPRVYEKIEEKLRAIGAHTKGLKKSIAGWAKANSLSYQKNLQLGGSGEKSVLYPLANMLLINKVKAALGFDECMVMISGAAPIARETLEFFGGIGININEIYGMSECSGSTTISNDKCHIWGSVGYEIPGGEVKIFDSASEKSDDTEKGKKELPKWDGNPKTFESCQGEVCFRGRHVMKGFMANPNFGEAHEKEIMDKTKDSIDSEGWLHSGDRGYCSKEGMIYITGRFKELIIGAGGENVSPVPIENALKLNCPFISNAVMIGDKRKFNVVLIALKTKGATGELPGTNELLPMATAFGCTTISEAASNTEYTNAIAEALKKTNADGTVCPSTASRIQKFTIIPQDLSVQNGELTPSLKAKRAKIAEIYDKAIDAMYASKDVFVNTL